MATGSGWWSDVWPGVSTVAAAAAGLAGKQLWTSFFSARSDDAKEDKADERARRALLRNIDVRAGLELDRSWKRLDKLAEDVDHERSSGVAHYNKTLRMYDLIVELVHDWRNGKPPPDKTPDFDSI